jgi:putative FmdB family regulatory protein
MPIYAYRCEACGFARDVLQKVSDAPLTECTSCGKPAFKKQLTAAGFQLKGTGWYATDFRGGATTAAAPAAEATDAPAKDAAVKSDTTKPDTASTAAPAAPATGSPSSTV